MAKQINVPTVRTVSLAALKIYRKFYKISMFINLELVGAAIEIALTVHMYTHNLKEPASADQYDGNSSCDLQNFSIGPIVIRHPNVLFAYFSTHR
jgi:hypothetical protein